MKNIIRGIKNLWRWFPIIWKDRDWDDYYIWEILKTKLKHQSKYIGDRNTHTTAKYEAERIQWCIRLIEKIQNDFYIEEHMDFHKSDYNWVDIGNGRKELKIIEIYENYDIYLSKYKSSVRKILANKEFQVFEPNDNNYKQRLAMNLGHYNEKRAQDLLFKILNKHVRNWWD
jgi:hypothetical protein